MSSCLFVRLVRRLLNGPVWNEPAHRITFQPEARNQPADLPLGSRADIVDVEIRNAVLPVKLSHRRGQLLELAIHARIADAECGEPGAHHGPPELDLATPWLPTVCRPQVSMRHERGHIR